MTDIDYENMSREAIIEGMYNYMRYGYVIAESFNNPEDDAVDCLSALLRVDKDAGFFYCKKILESHTVDSDFFRSICLNTLLLSEKEWSYAFNYLLHDIKDVTIPELEKALFYFYCAKNEKDPYPVPDGLFERLVERYQMVKDEPDADFYHLHDAYNDFMRAYSQIS